jgi:hypothetical protein
VVQDGDYYGDEDEDNIDKMMVVTLISSDGDTMLR